jgi:hypothetical protein
MNLPEYERTQLIQRDIRANTQQYPKSMDNFIEIHIFISGHIDCHICLINITSNRRMDNRNTVCQVNRSQDQTQLLGKVFFPLLADSQSSHFLFTISPQCIK